MQIQEKYFNLELVKDRQGLITPMFCNQTWLDTLLENFEVRNSDVIIATYPKTGTTWVRQIVHLLGHKGEQGDQILDVTTPYIEAVENYILGETIDKVIKDYQTRKSPRYFATHLRPRHISTLPGYQQAKYIYVYRNPKDCMVSAYHFAISDPEFHYDGTWQEFFGLYLEGNFEHGMMFDHLAEWWRASKELDHIMFISYESMKEDLTAVVQKIADFINIPYSPELIRTVVNKSQFKSMKKNSLANMEWMSGDDNSSSDFSHLRKGVVGDWKNYFTSEQNEIFDLMHHKKLADVDLAFQFETK